MKILTLAITLGLALSARATELKSLKDFLKQELGASAKMSKEVFPLTPAQQKELAVLAPMAQETDFTFYYGKSADGKLERSCLALPQQGKEGPMVVGVCFHEAGLVQSVTILSSEEERGKKVAEATWLKQFKQKKVSDAFQVGQDVDGVSGATWSSKAVAESLRKASYAYRTFIGGK
jgi:Na+-translocating ferredoxin:NAD+ oxidoreductase RnfG subunit